MMAAARAAGDAQALGSHKSPLANGLGNISGFGPEGKERAKQ